MDNNSEPPKPRRPLPTPGAPSAQRPSTPVLNISPIPPSTFYGTTQPQKPPLPTRPSKPLGSAYTSYHAPSKATAPPRYGSPAFTGSPGFREPEFITEEPIDEDDDLPPDLIPPDEPHNWGSAEASWSQTQWPAGTWHDTTTSTTEWMRSGGYGDGSDYRRNTEVAIDGRRNFEEDNWWNPAERERNNRPGPGMLPPILAEHLHDTNHSLFCVNVSSSNFMGQLTSSHSTSSLGHHREHSISSTASSQSTVHEPSPNAPPPTEDEIRTSVPHPNAHYCPRENGWVILSWKASSVSPPLAASFREDQFPLPDQNRRRKAHSCIDDVEHSFGAANKTHHFHKYPKAIDSHKLTPPLREDEWQSLENIKQKRRNGTIVMDEINVESLGEAENPMDTESEGKLLDLYVCCQCSLYVVASGVIPGVIPRKHFEEFVRGKRNNPIVGKTGELSVVLSLETLLLAVENKLWKGDNRLIKIGSSGFRSKLGWSPNTKRILEILGFYEQSDDQTLNPPTTDPSTPEGVQNRRKLLRAWVEVNAWLADFKRNNPQHLKDHHPNQPTTGTVQIDSAREMYQTAIGAHPVQIPRGELTDPLLEAVRALPESWSIFGLTPTTFSPDLLAFAYLAQCRCDPANTMLYFTHLSKLLKVFQDFGSCPTQLQDLLVMERSRDRFTTDDLENAASTLGFGPDGLLSVDYDDEIPDEFVENAWKDCVKRSWRDHNNGSELHRKANEAFRILAEARGSVRLKKVWEAGKNKYMNPDRAYDTLEIPKDVDDHMLITVFTMRLEETPSQIDKMREAMTVIAEVRDSERLRQFLNSGQDPGDIVAPTRADLPRGLNQLGNTCYLNSLLQYFYTIKDLRDAVQVMSKLDLKSIDDEKFSDDDLKRHRVGGRLVTRREIVRSRKFINQLAELFFNLEYCESAAVTPTIDLAKLALVTSRDEEEDEADKGGTDSSNDTDATLVDDGPSRAPAQSQSPPRSSSTVLGKRPRDIDRQRSSMDVDSPIVSSPKDKDDYVMVPSPTRRSSSPLLIDKENLAPISEASTSKAADKDGDVDMGGTPAPEAKPPLPPRKREVNDSTMMFGKQHDVAECMDNCMFQIETALLKFDGVNDGESAEKTSVVKRLFYGKIRQRLTGTGAQRNRPSIHEKEDLFSHLPVNVTNDGVDIYDGLSGYFDDVVDYEGGKARMEVSLVDLPPLLQIQLQRVQFNRDTLQPYKSQAYVKFGETIYMDRFMDNANLEKKAKSKGIQAELNASRDRVRLLLEGKQDASFVTALDHTSKFLAGLQETALPGVDDDLLHELQDEQGRINAEIDQLRARVNSLKEELETLWRDSCEVPYELTSVFIHRGSSPSWGHYFFYSRHLPDQPDSWFKYNDSDVTVVSKDEVLADTTGSTANPYLLVFARKGSDVVDTVRRFDASSIIDL